MDNLQKLVSQIKQKVFVVILLNNIILIGGWWVGTQIFSLDPTLVLVVTLIIACVLGIFLSTMIARDSTEPVLYLWKAILHVSPNHSSVSAPNLEDSRIGRELVNSLVLQVYQLAGNVEHEQDAKPVLSPKTILDDLPLPTFVMNQQQNIIASNKSAEKYLGLTLSSMIGKPISDILKMSFSSNKLTYESWLNDCRANKVTDSTSWNRVRASLSDEKTTKQFDLASYYDKNNPAGIETIITIFDRTGQYTQDDDAMSYVALAVHELRTPLTLLRGYIEVLEEESEGKLDQEMSGYIHNIQASSQQLATFVSNILNVAKIEENQLTLRLNEENWAEILKSAGANMQLRASVRGINIEYDIAPNLPTVAVDKVSIFEVIYNLLDNAIKYSLSSNRVIIKSYLHESGMIETTVQDFGVGIQSSAMPNIFNKFYRNHRSKAQIGGTGLGLFLSKSIISAHGGQIWVKSVEGKGSVFGFTLQQYSQLDENLKNNDNSGIVRGAHGWIKNHSLYRR